MDADFQSGEIDKQSFLGFWTDRSGMGSAGGLYPTAVPIYAHYSHQSHNGHCTIHNRAPSTAQNQPTHCVLCTSLYALRPAGYQNCFRALTKTMVVLCFRIIIL